MHVERIPPETSPRTPFRESLIRYGSIVCAGIADAGVIGYWKGTIVECEGPTTSAFAVPCSLDSETVVLFLALLTVAAALLSVALVRGNLPRLASIASSVLLTGAALFPTWLAFPYVTDISGWNTRLVLMAMVAGGGWVGFLEPIRRQQAPFSELEFCNRIVLGGALIALSGWAAYWLPQNLSGGSTCSCPVEGCYCPLPSVPLIPEFDAIGLILLGFAVAVPIFIRRWSALGLVCAVGALVAGVIAGLASAGYLLAPALGVGAISALLGLIPMTATTRTKPSRVGA